MQRCAAYRPLDNISYSLDLTRRDVHGMANQVDEMLERDAATFAANVCAAVLSNGKHDGRFAMSIDALRRAMDLSEGQTKVATMWAAEREWVRLLANQVELKAAGIYVAKATLQLPR